MASKPRIALSAGHHNTTGGNALEIQLVGPATKALAQACRARGFDVRVITPDDGLGMFPGSVDKVAQQVVNLANAGWRPDLFIELHGESTATRGAFVVYPDWGLDRAVVLRDQLGPALANAIAAGTGIPRRGSGVMSEKQTAIGAGGSRLAVFRVTAPLKAFCQRAIIEMGSYGTEADLAIMTAPGFPERIAAALVAPLGAYVGLPAPQVIERSPTGIEVDPILVPIWTELGKIGRATSVGHLPGPGWAIGPLRAFPDGNGVMQACERYIIGQDRTGAPRIPLASEVKAWGL